jgi:hypothetical protein
VFAGALDDHIVAAPNLIDNRHRSVSCRSLSGTATQLLEHHARWLRLDPETFGFGCHEALGSTPLRSRGCGYALRLEPQGVWLRQRHIARQLLAANAVLQPARDQLALLRGQVIVAQVAAETPADRVVVLRSAVVADWPALSLWVCRFVCELRERAGSPTGAVAESRK